MSAIAQVGGATLNVVGEAKQILDFFGRLLVSTVHVLKHPKSLNLRDVGLTIERAGADAAPIVLLINFLMGFVMAYQSAAQLKQFGASIYVADLVGVSMTRELGPLMMAIIICGRSGAAFAAELGTMKVSEEVDALRTLGFLPLPFLVIPRMLGLVLLAPILVLMADAIGIVGGALVASLTLDITPMSFLIQLQSAVKTSDIVSGMIKGTVFCATIALISCQQGPGHDRRSRRRRAPHHERGGWPSSLRSSCSMHCSPFCSACSAYEKANGHGARSQHRLWQDHAAP
ncbi:MAG: ABC transporter permease [Pseudomonadota bacterium]